MYFKTSYKLMHTFLSQLSPVVCFLLPVRMRKICCIQEEAVLEREQEAAQCLWTDAGEV